jgi:hypothetical protein
MWLCSSCIVAGTKCVEGVVAMVRNVMVADDLHADASTPVMEEFSRSEYRRPYAGVL